MSRTSIVIICLISIQFVLTTGCSNRAPAKVLTPQETAPNIGYFIRKGETTLAVLDKKPYVVNGVKTPAFEG
jgi:hypothetical protein